MHKKTVLVTGGLGFIGSHLVRKLLANGDNVVVVDNLSNHSNSSLEDFQKFNKFTLVNHDVSHPLPAVKLEIGTVYHLAAMVSVPDSFNEPLRTHQVNKTVFINVPVFWKTHGVKKLVYASSCAEYDSSRNIPLIESEKVIPKSPYSLTKLNNEHYARFFQQAYGLESIGLHFFNVFGPGQKSDSAYADVISIFMDRAMKDEKVTIYDNSGQMRNFVYVEDISLDMIASAESDASLDVFNIGTGIETFINQLFDTISLAVNYSQEPNYAPARLGEVEVSCSDPSKIEKRIGFKTNWNLKDGIMVLFESM